MNMPSTQVLRAMAEGVIATQDRTRRALHGLDMDLDAPREKRVADLIEQFREAAEAA